METKIETAQQIRSANLPPCIWMQAGVVRRKHCRLGYECTACRYDRLMQREADANRRLKARGTTPTGKRGRIVSWREKLKEQPPWKRPCLHHMKQRIDFRSCTNDYSCSDCDFDQYFNDQFTVFATVNPVDLVEVDGFKIPQGYYLHRGHAWIKIEEENTVRVGLDEFTLRLLGPFDGIDAPLIGKTLQQGRADINLRRGDKTARLLSPVSGVVTACNIGLRQEGKVESRDAYADGWIVRAHSADLRRDMKKLMIAEETTAFLRSEIEQLTALIEQAAGPLAADGGHLGDDLYGKLPQLGWNRLVGLFLRS
jgi:glycine cleavage system H lipoate-binding protein